MPIPASVIQALETNNIAYQLKATEERMPSRHRATPDRQTCEVKSLLLQDSQGKLQILLPRDHLIDLNAIKMKFGRDLEPIDPAELNAMLEENALKTIPALPEWRNFNTIVDASLMRHPVLLLDSGDDDQSIELKLSDFQSMIKSTSVGDLAVLAPSVPNSVEMDREQILNSLKNFTQLRIKQRLEETLEMPPLPETASRIITLRADPDADISDLADLVELDPSLAAQVVSWAASPYYSAPGKIKSVHDAIVRVLGFDMVLNLSLGLALGNAMHINVMKPEQVTRYWQQAVCTAATVEALVTSIPRQQRPGFGMAYLSGLLNNFGYLVLAEIFPPYFTTLSRHFEVNSHLPVASIEQHFLGVSSCQIAAWLMEVWNMPEEIVTALRHQNNPEYDGDHAKYAKLLYVARQMLINHGLCNGTHTAIAPELFDQLYLDKRTAEISVENIIESKDDLFDIAEKTRG